MMNKIYAILFYLMLVAGNVFGALGISSLPATNITTTSAYFRATISGTNTINPTNTLFYGTIDYTTNASSWAYSNVYGVAGTGNISTQIMALSTSHKYYFRWLAQDGTSNIWTSATSNFWTKPSAPTTTPTVVTTSLQTDTNGVLKAHTNFFSVNSNKLIEALGGSAYEPLWEAASNQVQGDIIANAGGVSTNAGAITTNTANMTGVSNALDIVLTNYTGLPIFEGTTGTNTANLTGVSNAVEIIKTNYVEKIDAAYLAALTNGTLSESTSNAFWTDGRMIGIAVRTNYEAVGSAAAVGTNLAAVSQAVDIVEGSITTNNLSMTNTVHVPSSSNYLSYDSATRLLSECVTNQGGGGDASLWSGYSATQEVAWSVVPVITDTTNIIVTNLSLSGAGLDPDIVGIYPQIVDVNGSNAWGSAASNVYIWWDGGGYYIIDATTNDSGLWAKENTHIGIYAIVGAATGELSAGYSYTYSTVTNTATWTIGAKTNATAPHEFRLRFGETNKFIAYSDSNVFANPVYGNWAGTWKGLDTNEFYSASNPSNFYLSSNPSNWVDATVTNDLNGVVATKYPASNPSNYVADAITSMTFGVTDTTAFRGDNGAAVSAAVVVAEGNITTNTANITGVSNAFATADGVLSGQLVTAYSTADNTLSGQLVTAYGTADGVVSGQLVVGYTAADSNQVPQPTNTWTAEFVLSSSDEGLTTYAVAAGVGDFLASGAVPLTGNGNAGGNSWTNLNNLVATNRVTTKALTVTGGATNGGILMMTNATGQIGMLGSLLANAKLFINDDGTAPEYAKGIKVGTFNWSMTNTQDSTKIVTNVGFKPQAVIFIAAVHAIGAFSIGFDDGITSFSALPYNSNPELGRWLWRAGTSIDIEPGTKVHAGKITSFATTGFTFTWNAVTGSTNLTINVGYFAFR